MYVASGGVNANAAFIIDETEFKGKLYCEWMHCMSVAWPLRLEPNVRTHIRIACIFNWDLSDWQFFIEKFKNPKIN